jgi:hypothetical protein
MCERWADWNAKQAEGDPQYLLLFLGAQDVVEGLDEEPGRVLLLVCGVGVHGHVGAHQLYVGQLDGHLERVPHFHLNIDVLCIARELGLITPHTNTHRTTCAGEGELVTLNDRHWSGGRQRGARGRDLLQHSALK